MPRTASKTIPNGYAGAKTTFQLHLPKFQEIKGYSTLNCQLGLTPSDKILYSNISGRNSLRKAHSSPKRKVRIQNLLTSHPSKQAE